MPLINIEVIENVFSSAQKKEILEKVTETMVRIEGEALRRLRTSDRGAGLRGYLE